ncbi:MAG: thiolase family protein [Planctomycetes bacterium]|nr:thiolase family protein [Planctomycetota bacterium]
MIILDAKRTPLAPAGGVLKNLSTEGMLSQLISSLWPQDSMAQNIPDEFILGSALAQNAGSGNLARSTVLASHLPDLTPAITLNRMEGSSIDAVSMAGHKIMMGEAQLILAGGVERMSRYSSNIGSPTFGSDIIEKNPDACVPMLIATEEQAAQSSLSRQDLDTYAYESHQKASKALDDDLFKDEIQPLHWNEKDFGPEGIRQLETSLSSDEIPRDDLSMEMFSKARPSLTNQGLITSMNSAPMADGACLALLASQSFADSHNIKPLGRFLGSATAACSPALRGQSSSLAINKLLDRLDLSLKDIDLFQIGENFSYSALSLIQELGLDKNKVNIHGGDIAMGHAMGASGIMMLTHTLYNLRRNQKKLGLICISTAGGMSCVALVENIL